MYRLRKFFREFIHPTGPHPWRWRLIQVWIIVFTIVVAILIGDNHTQIKNVIVNKASIIQLQQTNCRLKAFLVQAEISRLQLVKHESGTIKQLDLKAAISYYKLATAFDSSVGKYCTAHAAAPPRIGR